MKLSIVIPVYNELSSLEQVLANISAALKAQDIRDYELIIVDDFSTDGTRELIKSISADKVTAIFHERNYGKGRALQSGFARVTGDITLIQDADMEYNPYEYNTLLQPILDGRADVVYGSRFAGGEAHRVLYYWHSWGNKFLTTCSNILSDLNLTDMETCYKVFKTEVLSKIKIEEQRFGFEPEVTAKLAQLVKSQNYRIYEVSISYAGRTYAEGKKINWRDGVRALWCIVKYNDSRLARVIRYGLSGILVALTQLLVMAILVDLLALRSVNQQSIANIIAIEISLLMAFLLHSTFTWSADKLRLKRHGLKEFLLFHLGSFFTVALRIILFYYLALIGFFYVANTVLTIALAVIFNFIFYNYIFTRK